MCSEGAYTWPEACGERSREGHHVPAPVKGLPPGTGSRVLITDSGRTCPRLPQTASFTAKRGQCSGVHSCLPSASLSPAENGPREEVGRAAHPAAQATGFMCAGTPVGRELCGPHARARLPRERALPKGWQGCAGLVGHRTQAPRPRCRLPKVPLALLLRRLSASLCLHLEEEEPVRPVIGARDVLVSVKTGCMGATAG